MKKRQALGCAVMILFLGLATAGADAGSGRGENPYLWRPTVDSVAVFKDGLGFFNESGAVALRDGWCVSAAIPPAAFGTLAIYSLVEGHQVDVVGSGPGEVVAFDGVDAPDDRETRRARLEATVGLELELTYRENGEERVAAGRLESVGDVFAVLDAPAGHLAVPIDAVHRLQLLNLPLRIHVVDLEGRPARETVLAMAYLRKGITWIPEYTLDVDGEERGRLELRASLVNEAVDLVHCDVNFVVGVPNFEHRESMAPIAVGAVIRSMGAAVLPQEFRGQIMSRGAIVSNALGADQFHAQPVTESPAVDDSGSLDSIVSRLPNVDGRAVADYTVHRVSDLTVRRGEKAIVRLLTTDAPFSHFYRWTPPERVKHMLALQNQSATSWTTGPCLILQEGQPLGEGLLRYTPAGGECQVEVTTAVNLAHQRKEEEVDRKLKAHNPRSNVYLDLVRLAGTLELRNLEPHRARIEIEIGVPGRPLAASDGGSTASDSASLVLGQRQGSVRWRIELEPGESVELDYSYERYVPSS